MNFLKRWKYQKDELPKWFRITTRLMLSPVILYPLMLFSSIFLFDSPSSGAWNYFEFFVIILYPLILFCLFNLSRFLYFKKKSVAIIINFSILSLYAFCIIGWMILLLIAIVNIKWVIISNSHQSVILSRRACRSANNLNFSSHLRQAQADTLTFTVLLN